MFAQQFKAVCELDSVAVCVSEDNFIHSGDFAAMAENYSLELEMMNDQLAINADMDKWIDEMEQSNYVMDMTILGLKF